MSGDGQAAPQHAISLHGEPNEAADFNHLSYANPDAPKGGRLTLGVIGSFDSLNPLIIKGVPAAGVRDFQMESLMARGLDEPFTLYGLLAQTIDLAGDGLSVTFAINPKARFSDRTPVTPEDVLNSFELLKTKGRPNHRTYFSKVTKAEKISGSEVRFTFADATDRELPLIIGLMPVFAKASMDADAFDRTTTTPLVGSGPYRVSKVDLGRSLTFTRDPEYWGREEPITRGRFNFDEIRFDYYREGSVMLEAYRSGDIDLRLEEDPKLWAEAYNFPALKEGRAKKVEFDIGLPAGMTGLVFNTRRPAFADPRVRKALIQLFDFEWTNRTLYNGLYKRSESYFSRSILASTGRPADQTERALIQAFQGSVEPDILDGTFHLPVTDGSGQNRANQRAAFEQLKAAGYELKAGKLLNTANGAALTFEILAANNSQEALLLSFARGLEPLGIVAKVRVVDSAQYQSRLTNYDYDMIQYTWPSSLSPGNEQLFRWSAKTANTPGSFNFAGVSNPAADAMISAMLSAKTNSEFTSAVRALDRVLLSGHYVVPLFHSPRQWVALWSRLAYPAKTPIFGYAIDTWWSTNAP